MKCTSVVPYPRVTWNQNVKGIGLGDSSGLGQFGSRVWEAPGQWMLRDAALEAYSLLRQGSGRIKLQEMATSVGGLINAVQPYSGTVAVLGVIGEEVAPPSLLTPHSRRHNFLAFSRPLDHQT